MKQFIKSRKILFFPVIFVFITFFFLGACDKKAPIPKAAPAKAPQATAPQSAETKETKAEETYTYDRGGKRDPFVSLVVTAIEKPRKGQTPLENYDVSAIKILGIVQDEKGYRAIITFPDGKGFTLREGMAIGLHGGKIQKIDKNYIVISERIKDYKGELKSKETTLKLREGEEE